MSCKIKLLFIIFLFNYGFAKAQYFALNESYFENKSDGIDDTYVSQLLNLRITQNNEKIQIELHKNQKGVVSFALYNNKMEQLYNQVLDINFTGNFTQILNLKNLNSGRYLLQVNKEGGEKVWKIFDFQKAE